MNQLMTFSLFPKGRSLSYDYCTSVDKAFLRLIMVMNASNLR
jgi:hypothetical protein